MKIKIKWIAILLGAALCLATAAYLLRDRLIAPRLAALVQDVLDRELGVKVAIGRLGGSLLWDIEIEGLHTVAPGTRGPLVSLGLKRLFIRYGPLELLRGPAGFVEAMRIEAEGLQAELDLGRGDPGSAEPGPPSFLPLLLPEIRVQDAAIALRWGDLHSRFDGIGLRVDKGAAGARQMRLTVADWSWSHPRLSAGNTTAVAQLALAADALEIQELSLGGGRVVAHARLGNVGSNTQRRSFEARVRWGAGRLRLAGDVDSEIIHARLDADSVELEPIAELLLQPVAGRLSADIDLAVPVDRPEAASGRLSLDLRHAKVQGVDLSEASVTAAAAAGRVRIAALEAASNRSRLSLTEADAPLARLLDGAWGVLLQELTGRFEIYSEELPRLLDLTGFRFDPPAARVPEHRLEIAGRLDAGRLRIPHASLSSGSNRMMLQNLESRLPPAPPGTPLKGDLLVDLPDLEALAQIMPLFSVSGSLKADATISGSLEQPFFEGVLSAARLVVAGQPVGEVSLSVSCAQQQVQVKHFAVRRGADALSGHGAIQLPSGLIDAAASFEIADLERLGEQLVPSGWTVGGERLQMQGRVRGQAILSGRWDSPDGELDATFEELGLRGTPFGSGSIRVSKNAGTIAADPLRLAQGGDFLELRGSYDIAAGQFGATRIQLDCAQIRPYLEALAPQWDRLSGRAAVTAEGSGPAGRPDFRVDLYLERIHTTAGSLGDIRLKAEGEGRRVLIETAESVTPAGKLRASGSLAWNPSGTVWDATLDAFRLSGPEVRLVMAQPARIRYDADRLFSIDRFEAEGPQGRIAAHGRLALEGASDLTLELTGVSGGWLTQLVGVPLAVAGLNARLRLEGPAAAPEFSLAGRVDQLGVGDPPLTLAGRFDLAYARRRLRIEAFEWTASEGHRVALSGTLPVDPTGDRFLAPGPLGVSAALRLPDQELLRSLWPAWPIASGALQAEVDWEGSWEAPRGGLRVNGSGLNPADPPGIAPPGPYVARVEVAVDARSLRLEAFEVEGPYAQLQGKGVWRDYPAFSRWASGRPAADGSAALEGRLAVSDLGWFARGIKDIRRVAGRLDVDWKLDGPMRDPRLLADIRLADGELRPEADMPPLQALNLQAALVGRSLQIERLQGELGGAPFQVTGAIENILAPEGGLHLDVRLKGDDLLLYRSRTLRARADADLRLSGPAERLALSGSLALTNGIFTKSLGLAEGLTAGSAKPKAAPGILLFSMESPPFRDMRFDVRISARRPFEVKNNLARGSVRPDLRLVGTGEAPELVGKVYLDPTQLFLPAGRMQFESGVILFEAVDPGRPRLDMVGTARMMGYDITAAVEGPYDEPSVTLSSVPPLPDAELLALVLAGQPPKTPGSGTVEKRQGLNVAVFIGRDILTRMPGDGSTENLQTVLERFDVEVGRSVTRSGDETINARFRVAEDVLRQKGTLYLTGEKDVFDHYNAGVRIVFRFP